MSPGSSCVPDPHGVVPRCVEFHPVLRIDHGVAGDNVSRVAEQDDIALIQALGRTVRKKEPAPAPCDGNELQPRPPVEGKRPRSRSLEAGAANTPGA